MTTFDVVLTILLALLWSAAVFVFAYNYSKLVQRIHNVVKLVARLNVPKTESDKPPTGKVIEPQEVRAAKEEWDELQRKLNP